MAGRSLKYLTHNKKKEFLCPNIQGLKGGGTPVIIRRDPRKNGGREVTLRIAPTKNVSINF